MPTKFELNVKTENLKAHYLVLMENVRIANNELTEKLKQKNILQIELDKTSKAIESAQNELSALLNTTKRNKLALQELSERLEKKERYLNNIEVVTMNKLSKINREIELKQSTINEKISEKENKINKLESYLNDLSLRIEDSQKKLDRANKEIAAGLDIKKELEKDIYTLSGKQDNLEKSFNREYTENKEVLKHLEDTILEKKESIESPLEFLKKRELEVEKRERNLKTLIRRFKVYYDKYFPDRELKI